MHIVQPGHIRTTILSSRTPARRHALLWRIGDGIPGAAAALALEDVEKAEPVADFVGGAAALIVVCGGAAGDGVGEDVATVFFECGTGSRGAGRGGEVADAEKAAAEVGEEIDVQVDVCAFAEGCEGVW